MSKRTVFTTVTPLPAMVTRETVLSTLHDHVEMILLNPLVEEQHPIKPPPIATAEEYHCQWYSLTDRVQYLPGGLMSGKVTYQACFHDLATGLQTHCYAPMGLNIRGKWTLGGSLPGEPVAPVELGVGVPLQGLYLREDVDMKCNMMMTGFVKKTLKKAHVSLVDRLVVKAQIQSAAEENQRLNTDQIPTTSHTPPISRFSTQHTQSSSDSKTNSRHDDAPPLYQHPAHRDQMHPSDSALYPEALSVRSSTTSFGGSADGSNFSGRPSYQESVAGSQNNRVSWQQLNPNRQSPSMHPVEAGYQNTDPYRHSTQSSLSADFSARSSRGDPRYSNPLPPPPQKSRPAELE
ncbi:Uncharacterized protein BP5553_08041 [Venustampulla echinocandica]|uniref:DUF7053 domain-containing protein n=1 Tax=Venustampulla echinocandica TaxID=2656787 RepID=A0A370TFJ9_9HELO|nr:Uncharacterized protein BP5553_08041 [Venustampulla echinocandica]RDL33673.1 Uncharacterized protein BP5553_08041 [Venustampulla echinocandica]